MKKSVLIAGAAMLAIAAPMAIYAADANMSGPMHDMMTKDMKRADVEAMVKQHFAEIDANHDGGITMEEVNARKDSARGERREHMFDRMDANGDGSISRDEFDSAHKAIADRIPMHGGEGAPHAAGEDHGSMGMHHRDHAGGPGMGMRMSARMFGQADANTDGKVTLPEAQTAALAHFDKVDANHDGTVTAAERMDYWKAKKADWMSKRKSAS